jgi:hypothetical protein
MQTPVTSQDLGRIRSAGYSEPDTSTGTLWHCWCRHRADRSRCCPSTDAASARERTGMTNAGRYGVRFTGHRDITGALHR